MTELEKDLTIILIVASSCIAGFVWRSHHPLKKPWAPKIVDFHVDCNVVPDISRSGKPGDWTISVTCQP